MELASVWEEELPFIFGQFQAGRVVALRFAGSLPECLAVAWSRDAEDLLAEAERPAFRALGMEIELGKVWAAAARGALPHARELALQAAAEARTTGQTSYEAVLLHDVVRLGDAGMVVERLWELAGPVQGALVPVYAAHPEALALADACEAPHTPALGQASQPAALTQREREVALLAAAGVTSKDIAAQLVVSVRTVQNHLQRAYEKLGVTSREELAGALDLPDPAGAVE